MTDDLDPAAVERAARTLFQDDYPDRSWDDQPPAYWTRPTQDDYRRAARAARTGEPLDLDGGLPTVVIWGSRFRDGYVCEYGTDQEYARRSALAANRTLVKAVLHSDGTTSEWTEVEDGRP